MNTWLLLDILKFMGRDQLESLQIVSRVLNNMIRQTFASGPYRILRHNNLNASLEIDGFKEEMMNSRNLNLKRYYHQDNMKQSFASGPCHIPCHSDIHVYLEIEFKDEKLHLKLSEFGVKNFYVDPLARRWEMDKGDDECHFYPIQEMRPLLAENVRIPHSFIIVNGAFTIWHIEELESISHLWSGQRFDIQYCSHHISNDLMFQSSKLLRCHILDLDDLETTTQLHLYPLLYTLPWIHCHFVNTSEIVEIVREKARYPQSNTVFRLTGDLSAMEEAIKIIREDFLASSNPYGFEVILEVWGAEWSQLEFRVENNRTKEVLQLKKKKKKDYFYDPTENHFLFQRYFL
ncbi:hypothetical protein DdX_12544 [Ditylenchus destructor]|uniref:F-box domain-containing protein n=1 Tax=Ditylenchus destructor TaxID=166010 RepID=A0AAD4QX79_9BILA|nr:hypothetical protein DdX_12544 [Ditylenchus destructor]